ncbi:MAG: MiaB/RimO family radical SAM methylthiotransferase [Phycisphaerae bacterium]|nr:MiaB/RimO family radical SAM methylthiotransferase [Phycisphaerae bacterium]
MRRFKITTLGCKVNQYDGQAIAETLVRAGLRPAPSSQMPDVVIINTCCVTAAAMRKSRQAIRRAVRNAPAAAVAITGCYTTYDAKRIHEILEMLAVPEEKILLAGHHDDLATAIRQWINTTASPDNKTPETLKSFADFPDSGKSPSRHDQPGPETIRARRLAAIAAGAPAAGNLPPIREFPGHQRAFVKIQDGCDAFCTYCIVPYARARVFSKSPRQVIDECRQLAAAGHREIVLCGVFLGAYGRNTAIRRHWTDKPSPLPQLLRNVADIEGLWRVRLSSLEPADLNETLLAVAANNPAVAPHFHLPLQSGSERILKKMNRQYTPSQYRRTIERLQNALDRPAISTDIIVGFPGETDEDFAATLDIARQAGYAKIHAFPFSAIKSTAAWQHRNETPPGQVVRERLARLSELETESAEKYRRQFLGETLEGLVESTIPGPGLRKAMTDRYLTVEFDAPKKTPAEQLTGQIVRLKIQSLSPTGLKGTLAGNKT